MVFSNDMYRYLLTNRGIIFNGLTPYDLYLERKHLYEKYCDIKLKTNVHLAIDSFISQVPALSYLLTRTGGL